MKIEDVKKLDDGVSNITIEGKIIKTPKEPRDSEFGWSQMIILKDDTGEIGSWINIESAEDAYKVGQYIKIKGKVSKYVKGGNPGISLNNGNVIDEIVKVDEDVSQEKPITQPKTQPINQPVKPEKDMDKVWEGKDLRIARECAIKAVTELAVSDMETVGVNSKELYFRIADEIVDYIYNGKKITSEAISKELGGTAVEIVLKEIGGQITEGAKANRIEQAKEIVNQASQAQKDMVEKIIKSRYIKKEELEKMGGGGVTKSLEEARNIALENINKITKDKASSYISYWFGSGVKVGERAGREIEAQGKEIEQNPFATKEESIKRRDKDDDTSLSKDMLIDEIQAKRKELHLEDNEKFEKTIGYNPKLEELTEEKLLKLKSLLKDWRPDWVKK